MNQSKALPSIAVVMPSLGLLGVARWLEKPISPGPALWLMTYLALAETWVDRFEIAGLLWADVPEADARNNLRQLLHRSKSLEWAKTLESNNKALRLQINSDVGQFRKAVRQADWQTALEMYNGALLEGIEAPRALETWLESERSALQDDWREALVGRIGQLEASPDANLPNLLVQLLSIDPYNEEALHGLLKYATARGQSKEALKQFELFQARLHSDLGVEPQPETLALVASLRGQAQPDTNLRFVGRYNEQAEIRAQLEAGTRLLMLRGAGGIGKTTLAKEILNTHQKMFDHTAWVTLRDAGDLDAVPLSIAAALGLSLRANQSPWEQLGNLFKERQMLLVLDNLEHLTGIAEPLVTWLEVAPKLTLLLTSRVALNVPDEWVFTLEGLDYPSTPDLEVARHASAVQLFVARAARRRGGFTLNEKTLAGVLRICQLVQGLPLGLELAAAWMGELSLEALVEGLEANSDLLEVADPTMPSAHRTLRTVFEHSWELLEDDLRHALCAISVFQGGFDRNAAVNGMNIPARALLGLIARSLLQNQSGGRYELHPLVQTFAKQKLEPEAQSSLQLQHAEYFTSLAKQAQTHIQGGSQQVRWLEAVAANHLNFLAVCDQSLNPTLALSTASVLNYYWMSRGHYLIGLQRLEQALKRAKDIENDLLLAQTHLAIGIQGNFLAVFEHSNQHLETALRYAQQAKAISIEARALNWYGANLLSQGKRETAQEKIELAIQRLEPLGDPWALGCAYNDLGRVYSDYRDIENALLYFEKSLECARICQDRHQQAIALHNISNHIDVGPKTYQLIQESMKLKLEIGHESGYAMSLHAMGSNLVAEEKHLEAIPYLLEAMRKLLHFGRFRDAAYSLIVLAEPSLRTNQNALAMIIYGAARTAYARIGAEFAPRFQWHTSKLETENRQILGDTQAEALYLKGSQMSLEEAYQFVKQNLQSNLVLQTMTE